MTALLTIRRSATRVSATALAALLLLAPGAARAAGDPDRKTTPAAEATGEPEGLAGMMGKQKVDPRIWKSGNPALIELARHVEDGTATLPMLRAFHGLSLRLAPFDRPVPADYLERARAAERRLRPRPPAAAAPLSFLAQPIPPALVTRNWALLGPATYNLNSDKVSGRATAIWVDPANKNNILLGTADGGLWKTTDQGTTWTPLFDGQPTLSIGAIGVDPNNAGVIYIGTGEGNFSADLVAGFGIFKSTNGGTSWTQMAQPAWPYAQPYHNVRRIVVDPRDSNKVYAAVDGGLYYSLNAGSTWTLTTCGAATGPMGTDVVLDSVSPVSGSPSIVYVAFGYYGGLASNGVYRSTNAASSWTEISVAPSTGFPGANVGRITLVKAPSDPRQLYALVQSTATYQSLGIFYTADASAATVSWVAKSTTNYCSTQCWYDMHGTVDPAVPGRLIVGGLDDYLSTDSGATLTQVSSWTGSGTSFSHADHHFLTMPDSTTLYDANDGGFFVGAVSGTTVSWSNRNAGLPTVQFYGFAAPPADGTRLTGGLQDNGQAYFNGTSWREVAGGDGGKAAWDQGNNLYNYEEYVYASISRNNDGLATNSYACVRNFGGCASCSGACVPDGRTSFIAPFILDADDQNTMFTGSYQVYRNQAIRSGSAWSSISGDLSGGTGRISALHAAKNNGVIGVLYAGTTDGKAQMTSNSNTATPPAAWTNISAGLSGAAVTSFATHPASGLSVLVTLSGYGGSHVYRSTTGGAAWTDITGGLPAVPFNSIALDPADPNHAYAASDYGVYENTAVWTTATWSSILANLPAVANDELGFNPVSGKLRTASHGRGIWELTVTTTVATPVSSGAGTTPLRAAKGTGANINLTFDTTTCTANGGYNAYWGNLTNAALAAYAYGGSQCAIASGGAVTSIPASGSAFIIVAGTDGGAQESRNTQDSSGAWHGSGVGMCGITSQNTTSTCP